MTRNRMDMAITAQATGNTRCSHHWVIDAAKGPISRGVCRLCQEVRDFKNAPSMHSWGKYTKK